MKRSLCALLSFSLAVSDALAETVYVTARPSPCTVKADCPGANPDGTYSEQFSSLGDYGVAGSAVGHPVTTVARGYVGTAAITDPASGVTLTPTLGVPGGTYRIDYNFNSLAGNTSTDVVMTVTCTAGGTLSFNTTDKFQRLFGSPANQWNTMGYLTNDAASATPTIEFRYLSGTVSGGSQNRLLFDCWRFVLVEPCLAVAAVTVAGPLAANVNEVVVSGVDATATQVAVYQNSGSGMVKIGAKTEGVVVGNNTVTVSGLVKSAQVAATQTINNQEGCVPPQGILVGGGANPQMRIALSIRETPTTNATVGTPGITTNSNLHFLGASTVTGGAPVDAPVVHPSNGWQTVTFSRGMQFAGNVSNVAGTLRTPPASTGYAPGQSVEIQVYAFRTVLPNDVKIFSRVGGQSSAVASNDVFGINWTWTAVPGAEGYRVLRSLAQAGYYEGADVSVNSFLDTNDYSLWTAGSEVTPTGIQTGPSIQWNGTVVNATNLPGTWGTLESINFVIDDLTDTGPFDLYIDNIQNGETVFQTFEEAPAGTTDYGFRAPGFSSTTSGNLLTAPDLGVVANERADTGTKSFRVRFQWNTLSVSKWVRLTTSGVAPASNPYVNLDEPISFRLLLQPVGASPLPTTTPPTLSATLVSGTPVLNWVGGHRLQTSDKVSGSYTNVLQTISPNTYLGPWTNTFSEPAMFFRLVD